MDDGEEEDDRDSFLEPNISLSDAEVSDEDEDGSRLWGMDDDRFSPSSSKTTARFSSEDDLSDEDGDDGDEST